MPHNGFIYEAQMDMMENSGHWPIAIKHFNLILKMISVTVVCLNGNYNVPYYLQCFDKIIIDVLTNIDNSNIETNFYNM